MLRIVTVFLVLAASILVAFFYNSRQKPPTAVMSSRAALPSVMQAIRVSRFGGPNVLAVEKNVPLPRPGNGEVVMRVHASGINPVDTYIRAGTYARKPELPYTPGSDAAGEVAELGAGVENVKVGDRVFTRSARGACAQYALTSADDVQPLPDKLSYEQGAALPVPYLTAFRALFTRGHAKSGETVLIHGGTGAVGVGAIQLALSHGLRVLATGGSEEGIEMMKTLGAHATFNHRQPGYVDQIYEETGKKGVDVILENLANVNLDADLKLLAYGGRVMVVGSRGRIEIDPRAAMMCEADIRGVMLFHNTPEDFAVSYQAIQAGIRSGHINPVVGKRWTLAQAPTAHEHIIENTGALGKSVFVIE